MPDKLKLIPREEPEKAHKPAKKTQQKKKKNKASIEPKATTTAVKSKKIVSSSKQSPHLQKQYAIEHNQENKKIKTVGYKLVDYATSVAKLSQQEIYELIHDAQRSVLYLQKHHRKMIKKKKKKGGR